MKANDAKSYDGNYAIVEGLGRGEIALGLVNNYYLYRFTKDNPNFPVAIHSLSSRITRRTATAGGACSCFSSST